MELLENCVKMALRKFCDDKNEVYFPVCDEWGSAVIMKFNNTPR